MIYFREVIEPHVDPADVGWMKYWHVECYDDSMPMDGLGFPIGVAYVQELVNRGEQLQFFFVADEWRRQGFGTKLLLAMKDRWPEITWTSAMGEAGAAALKAAGFVNPDEDCD